MLGRNLPSESAIFSVAPFSLPWSASAAGASTPIDFASVVGATESGLAAPAVASEGCAAAGCATVSSDMLKDVGDASDDCTMIATWVVSVCGLDVKEKKSEKLVAAKSC